MSGIIKALMYVSIFSGAVPLVLMFIYKKSIKQKHFIWLGLLILSSFLTDITSLIAIKTHLIRSNAYFGNFYNIIQFILLLLIYHEFYLKEKKLLILILCLIYFGFEIVNSIYFQKLSDPQTWTKTLSAMIFLGLAIGYVEHLLKRDPLINLLRFAPGWINIAVFFYFGFSLYIFIMAEYVFTSPPTDVALLFWGFHNFNNILKHCLFATGIYLAKSEK